MCKVLKSKLEFILSALLIIGLFTGCNNKMKVIPAGNVKNYEEPRVFLQSNVSTVDTKNDDNYSSFGLLDDSLKNKEIFLTGTQYGIKADSELDLRFLKYFKFKAGVKYYLCELPYSASLYLNRYLETGDESLLQNIYGNILKGTILDSKDDYEKWKKIYEMNKSFSEAEKIKVVGINMEFEQVSALKYMYSLVDNLIAPSKIEPIITELKRIGRNPSAATRDDIKDLCLDLKRSIEDNRDTYNQYLAEKTFDLEMINDNIINAMSGVLYRSEIDFNRNNNKVMYENFIKLNNHLQKGKYYGQFYLNNIFQKPQNDIDYLAVLLNGEKSPFKGKVLSVAYVHKDSVQMIPVRNKGYTTRNLSTYSSTEDILGALIKTDPVLFKLTGERSPFDKELLWFLNPAYTGPTPKEGVTTDYFQFIVMIQNSSAAVPFVN